MSHIDTSPAALRKLAEQFYGVKSPIFAEAYHLLLAIAAEKEAQQPEPSMSMFASRADYDAAVKAQHHCEQPLEMVAPADVPLPAHTISGPAGTGTYFNGHTDAALLAHREAYAKAKVAAERERCARLCDEVHAAHVSEFGNYIDYSYAVKCKEAIRAAQKGTV